MRYGGDHRWMRLGFLIYLAGAVGVAVGQTSTPSPAPTEHKASDFWTRKTLTGEWGGLRPQWEDKGIAFELFYMQQLQKNFMGGLDTHSAQRLSGSYDLHLILDFGKMGLWKDAGFFMEAKGTWSKGINPDKVGALFNVNADAGDNHPIFVKKWWVWQKFLDKKVEVRLGMLETNKNQLFDISPYAAHEDIDFINRGSIRNATIPHRTGIGVFAKVEPVEWLYVQAGAVDANSVDRRIGFDTAFHEPDWYVGLVETGVKPKWKSAKGPMPGNVRVGAWYDPRPKALFTDTLGGSREAGKRADDMGYYLGLDQLVWKENAEEKDTQGLGVFARYGHAHQDANQITDYWSVGASYKGLIPTRDADVTAFAVSQGILSERYGDEIHPGADRETVYEWYYAYQLTPWCVISPHAQVVVNPGGDKYNTDAIVGGVRVRFTF